MTLGRSKLLANLGALALMIAAPAVSRASTVYSNFTGSFLFNSGGGNLVGDDGLGIGDNLGQGDTFTPGATYTFQSLEIALSCEFSTSAANCPDDVTVDLETSSSNAPSGTILESFTVTGRTLQTLGATGYTPLTSLVNPTLTSSVQYWIVVLADTNDTVVWNWNTAGDSSAQAVSSDGGTTWLSPSGQAPGAYEVDGALVGNSTPEPGTLGMILGGGALLGLLRKVRGQRSR
jgi:hypothetical protein